MIDSNDTSAERLEAAKEELYGLMQADELRDAAVLILANKQDLPNAMSAAALTDKLGLYSVRNREWFMQSCCGTTGDGIYEGLDWLTNALQKRR